jgi:hypothetical protein
MMQPLVVYTAICGAFPNILREPLNLGDRPVRFVCFTDLTNLATGPWEILPPAYRHENPRRTARWHKTRSHGLFPGAITLWMDGNQQLTEDPWLLADRYLGEHDIATYKHPQRSCIYAELAACTALKKDDPKIMNAQVARYRDTGYPADHGLAETTVMLRKDTQQVRLLNDLWWSEIRQGSLRDQLSFNYALWRLGLDYSIIAGSRAHPVHFKFFTHR